MNFRFRAPQFVRSALATSLLLILTGPVDAQHSETPIKVGGGAMTFYIIRDGGDWVSIPGSPTTTFCAAVPSVSPVTVDGFDHKDSYDLVTKGTNSWRIELQGQTHSVIMEADTGLCGAANGPFIKISIKAATDGSNPDFYPAQLTVARKNRRFKDPSCGTANGAPIDEDVCERISRLILKGVPHSCDDRDCRVLVGQTQTIPPAPARRRHPVRHHPHPSR